MPANLPQTYRNAEKQYRRANSAEEELQCLEWMLREIPKHKGTDKLQADLRRRISQTKARLNSETQKSGHGFRLPRQGAARVVIIGPANSGKTALFNQLTGSKSEVADYPHTTQDPQPAIMVCNQVKLQLVDTPSLTFAGLDPRTEGLIRGADLVLLLCDLSSDDGMGDLLEPIEIIQSSQTRLGPINSIHHSDVGVTYTETVLIGSKFDVADAKTRLLLFEEFLESGIAPPTDFSLARKLLGSDLTLTPISLGNESKLNELQQDIFRRLGLIRIYTKMPHQKKAEMTDPIALPKGSTAIDAARELHEDLADNFRQAKVWGSGKHDGTVVQAEHELQDGDIIEIRTR